MSYQVLARKWRPKDFSELVGQQQTAQALINALESQRLHHAYLFTGTRGVGKTTIARILSKSLNCEKGITSAPCGECSSCIEISQGNFVDLLEIDAASKTKVEDTRELLDNVQYRPTRGRYKVYLIDEVHMLSGHSFNALLKTLEEPPPHVIFLLATTDPQKMPVTVLSRCLQFHLRRMEIDEITGHLSKILTAENIECEEGALDPIARGADGSMRDALSLLDQAIAYCGQGIQKQVVLDMLGSIDREYAFQILDAIQNDNAEELLKVVDSIAQYSPDYEELLSDWLSLLHQLAVAQATKQYTSERIEETANGISPADLQLYYQLSLHAKRDLGFSPHPRQGFEMALLRILAFKPQTSPTNPPQSRQDKPRVSLEEKGAKTAEKKTAETETVASISGGGESSAAVALDTNRVSAPQMRSETLQVSEPLAKLKVVVNNEAKPEEISQPTVAVEQYDEPEAIAQNNIEALKQNNTGIKSQSVSEPDDQAPSKDIQQQVVKTPIEVIALSEVTPNNWFQVVAGLKLTGHGLQILLNATASNLESGIQIDVLENMEPLLNASATGAIEGALADYFNQAKLKIKYSFVSQTSETPRQRLSRLHELAIDETQRALLDDPQIKHLIEHLGAKLPRESIMLSK